MEGVGKEGKFVSRSLSERSGSFTDMPIFVHALVPIARP